MRRRFDRDRRPRGSPGAAGSRRERCRSSKVFNKCDAITADERRRLQDQDPAALCMSALQREGVGELIDTLASRLALDIRRITLTFDPDEPADRERIARVYRHGRVLEHETRDGRITLVADVPRRLVSRLESR
jgi:50S ribosomal subunit-associated GTPase HflX